MAVTVCHQFIGPFGGRVKLKWMVYAAMFAEWHFRVGTIDAAGARVGQMAYAVMATVFQNVCKSYYVALNVGVWIFQTVTNSCLRREMNDSIKLALLGKALLELRTT